MGRAQVPPLFFFSAAPLGKCCNALRVPRRPTKEELRPLYVMKLHAIIPFFILMLSSMAAAQDAFDRQVASVILLQDRAVQNELKITEQQRTQMNKFADQHRGRLDAYGKQLQAQAQKNNGQVTPDEKRLEALFEELKKNVFSQLNATQIRRLREISLQALGVAALSDNVVAKRVGLNDSQLKRVRDLVSDGFKRANDIQTKAINDATKDLQSRKPANEAEQRKLVEEANKRAAAAQKRIEPQLNKLRTEVTDKVMAVLTAQQRQTWNNLLGKPFKG
jgi:hypothetical protein